MALVILLSVSAFGNTVVDGNKEFDHFVSKIECTFGGNTYVYTHWDDHYLEGNLFKICMDKNCEVRVVYFNSECRRIRNKTLKPKPRAN